MITLNTDSRWSIIECAQCGILFAILKSREDRLRQTHEYFYCPNGHSQYYPQQTEVEKLRKQLSVQEQKTANYLNKYKLTLSKLPKRDNKGKFAKAIIN